MSSRQIAVPEGSRIPHSFAADDLFHARRFSFLNRVLAAAP
jgi:hypothetical protein